MLFKFLFLLASLSLILTPTTAISPASNCLGNCIACSDNNPLLCHTLLNSATGKEYPCLPYYTGNNCQQTVGSYYNMYNETGTFLNWSLPSPPPVQSCKLLPSSASSSTNTPNASFSSIGPFSGSLNATKSLSFSAAQNVQRLIIKISVAVADAALYSGVLYANETTTETIDAEGNIIIETVSTNSKNSTLSSTIPFLNLDLTDQQNSNSLLASFSTYYQSVSITNTSCGFIYQYEFVADATGNPFRQVRLNFYLSTKNSQTTWYLLGFSAEVGCSGFAVSTGNSKCSTCLSGFYPVSDPDGNLKSCSICDYRCITCSSASNCLLCEAYTTSSAVGKCQYPDSYGVYQSFSTITGKYLNLSSQSSSQFFSVASSQAQVLNLGLNLTNNQSYLIKFYLLYSLSYAQNLTQLDITVNGKPYTSLSSLDTLSSALIQETNSAASQLYLTAVKIDLMGKPCLQNFSIGLKGSSQANEQFYVANMVLVQYSCGVNCLNCVFSPSTSSSCTACMPFFSLANSCKTCANGFYLKNGTICVKCYSNCKQCRGPELNDCTSCLAQFTLGQMNYDTTCIPCLYRFWNGSMSNCNLVCPQNFTISQLNYNSNCSLCLNADNSKMYSSLACQSCWIGLGIGSGKCIPLAASGFVFYASDLPNGRASSSLWTSTQPLSALTCTSDYVNLYGIAQSANHSSKTPSSLTYTLTGLPAHRGIIIVLNIFKVDDWLTSASAADNNVSAITIVVSSPGFTGSTYTINLTNLYGSNICGSSGREMIWAVQADLKDHVSDQAVMTITAPDQGIFVREVEVYLGNCATCEQVGLAYEIFGLPMYSDNDTQTGLDLWITFNHPIYYTTQGNQSQDSVINLFANSFRFSIDGTPVPNATLTANQIPAFNYLKYFLPLSQSYTNSTLTVNTSQGNLVYTSDGSVSRQLVSSSQTYRVQRYDYASPDTRRSTSQMSSFFHFFTWFTLIFMIVCVMLGVGVVFEEFSIMLQLIYYHIYITSALLPPTLKVPLANAVRMEHLNYFADIAAIENSLFGSLSYPADYIFQQYNVDVYFLRSFYPIMIINAIYLGWFIIHAILYRLVPACRQSEHKAFRFLRSIPQRPLAFFDQIWRYQFLATMWACLMQFTNFKAQGGQAVSLLICLLAFVISLGWPLAVTIYTYRRHFVMNVNHFRYCYHDLYYLKISSVADEPKYYLYVGVRFGKLLAYAIFIALFINQSIIGPVLLIFFNIIEAVVAYFLKIYRSGFYLFTRVIENLLLCISAILCLVIFGNGDTLAQESFENLGYGLATVFVLMVINGICRFIYLIYKKAYEWKIGTYDVGEVGEKEEHDGQPIQLAQSERV